MGNQIQTPATTKEETVKPLEIEVPSFEEMNTQSNYSNSPSLTSVVDEATTILPPPKSPKDVMEEKGKLVSDCMLGQYFATAAGVGIGLAMGMQRRNVRPFLVFATAGTVMDFVHGYTGPCRTLIEEFNVAVKEVEEERKINGTK